LEIEEDVAELMKKYRPCRTAIISPLNAKKEREK